MIRVLGALILLSFLGGCLSDRDGDSSKPSSTSPTVTSGLVTSRSSTSQGTGMNSSNPTSPPTYSWQEFRGSYEYVAAYYNGSSWNTVATEREVFGVTRPWRNFWVNATWTDETGSNWYLCVHAEINNATVIQDPPPPPKPQGFCSTPGQGQGQLSLQDWVRPNSGGNYSVYLLLESSPAPTEASVARDVKWVATVAVMDP